MSSDSESSSSASSLLKPLISSDSSSSSESAASDERIAALTALIEPESNWSHYKEPVKQYYQERNEVVESLRDALEICSVSSIVDAASGPVATEEEGNEHMSKEVDWAIKASLFATLFMLTCKLFAAVSSGSIAILSSSVDSMLDILSQGTLLFTSRLVSKHDPYRFPHGKSRIEPLSVVIFSVIMGMAAFGLLFNSLSVLITGLESDQPEIVTMNALNITALVIVVITQSVFFVWCRSISQRRVAGWKTAELLAQDHFNDVLVNLMAGIPAVIAGFGSRSIWWIDPLGGVGLSVYIAVRWAGECAEQFGPLVGKAASRQLIGQLTFLAATHDPRILKVDTVLAYHVGPRFQCEVHIVLPADMPLKESHDIAESLEIKIERLEEVEIAFVHNDYEFLHPAEHRIRRKVIGDRADSPVSAGPAPVMEMV